MFDRIVSIFLKFVFYILAATVGILYWILPIAEAFAVFLGGLVIFLILFPIVLKISPAFKQLAESEFKKEKAKMDDRGQDEFNAAFPQANKAVGKDLDTKIDS